MIVFAIDARLEEGSLTNQLCVISWKELRRDAEQRRLVRFTDEVHDLVASSQQRRQRQALFNGREPNCWITATVTVKQPGKLGWFRRQVAVTQSFPGLLLLDGFRDAVRIGFDSNIRAVGLGGNGVIYVSTLRVDPANPILTPAWELKEQNLHHLYEVKQINDALKALAEG